MFQFSSSFSALRMRSLSAAPFVLLALSAVVPASATLIQGHLGIAPGALQGVTVTNTTITFGSGLFTISAGNTGYFTTPAFDAPGYTGTIKNLNSDPAQQPVGSPFLLSDFLSFTNDLTRFDLRYIAPGVNGNGTTECLAPAAAGQKCTPLLPGIGGNPPRLSPFNLANLTTTSSTASFGVSGSVRNGTDVSYFTGTFSTTFDNMSFQTVLANLARDGQVVSPYSATFDVVAPEPATFALVGLALVGAAAIHRRRQA